MHHHFCTSFRSTTAVNSFLNLQNQLDRQSSVSDLNGNQFDMAAYANPVYDPGRGDEVASRPPTNPVVQDDLVLQPRPGQEINHNEFESTA